MTPCWTTGFALWITGTCVLTGGTAATGALGAASADPSPYALNAVTTTVTVKPTSALVNAYASPVAPAMSWQSAPLQRCHW